MLSCLSKIYCALRKSEKYTFLVLKIKCDDSISNELNKIIIDAKNFKGCLQIYKLDCSRSRE